MGYESDVILNKLNYRGDFPLQHDLGNFGEAQGKGDYTLSLDNPVKNLRIGMEFLVKFTTTNTNLVTLDIDDTGAKNVVTRYKNLKTYLNPGDIVPDVIYQLIWDGTDYIITGSGIDSDYGLD